MTNQEVNAIKEFRRFATTFIYPYTSNILINKISEIFNSNGIMFVPNPQQIIQFTYNDANNNMNKSEYTEKIHVMLKKIFIEYFNNADIISIIRNRIYVNIKDDDMKKLLMSALLEIQYGNPQYLSLLFNITILNNIIYLYL